MKNNRIKTAMNNLFKSHNTNGVILSTSPASNDYDDLEEALMNKRFANFLPAHVESLVVEYGG